MESGFDIVGALFAIGIVFWLAGGASWVAEKTRKLKLENDCREKGYAKAQQRIPLSTLSFPNGLTVTELKALVAHWPETTVGGEPCEVCIQTNDGLSSPVIATCPLNFRKDGDKEAADLLLSSVPQ